MRQIKRKQRHIQGIKKEPPVLVVKPHRQDNLTCEFTSQFLSKAFKRGIADYVNYASMSPDLARNTGIHSFLHSGMHRNKTHIFFLDDDSTPYEDFAIERLLSLKKPIVAGVTPIVRTRHAVNPNHPERGNQPMFLDCMWSAIIQNKEGKMENIGIDELPNKPFIAHRAGGTCLLVRRDVLNKLKPPYQKFEFDDHQLNVKRSEDIYFTDKVREAGFDLWIDPQTLCHHYHNFDLLDIFMMIKQAMKMKA